MANRHLARSIVMQTLFTFDFNEPSEAEAREVLQYNITEFGPGIEDDEFMQILLLGALKKRSIIDEIIEKAAPEWPIAKINAVDRNVLRLGLYELLFGDYDQVPPKVAINEAIELAKSFGGESSGRFINGVLGAVYKEIGEPGKDQQSKKQKQDEIAYEDMPIEQKGGAVVYCDDHPDGYHLAMIHDVFGFWTLSKSSVHEEDGEDAEAAAVRALKEEMNLDVQITEKLGENEYIANHPEKGKIRKQVHYFLAHSPHTEITLGESGGLDDAKWFPLAEVADLRMYEDVTQLITQAAAKLLGADDSASVEDQSE